MADRTSAAMFAEFFEFLAKEPQPSPREFAARLWSMTYDYDFSPYQMYADDALEKLGLLRWFDEDGERCKSYCGDENWIAAGAKKL